MAILAPWAIVIHQALVNISWMDTPPRKRLLPTIWAGETSERGQWKGLDQDSTMAITLESRTETVLLPLVKVAETANRLLMVLALVPT